MSFDNPRILIFFLLFAALIPLVIARYRKDRFTAPLFTAAAPPSERNFLLREFRLRIILSEVFFLLFAGFLIAALAGPRWGMRIAADYRRGVDIVMAFDLSRSMNVRDSLPLSGEPNRASGRIGISRLERGTEIARELGEVLGDIRAGAAIGKGRGILAVPLTYDSETISGFLYSLDSLALTGRGTNLESLLNAAAAAFQDSFPSRRALILFSDGETHSGSFQAALEKIREAGISLCTVALGSDEGGTVPLEASPDAPGGVLLDEGGKPVISARQADFLRGAAEKTGGLYIDGSRDDAASVLAGYVNSLSAESRLSGRRREANPRWRIFVLASIVCLAGSRAMGFSRRKRERRPGKSGRALHILLLFSFFLLSSCAKIQGKLLIMEGNFFNTRHLYTEAISSYLRALNYEDSSPYAEYGLGASYFALEEGDAALERYNAAEKGLSELGRDHPELRYRIHYNTGIIHFEKGEYTEAVSAFREALKADSSRIEAKRNLELSLLTINRAASREAPPPESIEVREGAEENNALMEYLRRKEQEQWKSREWNEESASSGPDY